MNLTTFKSVINDKSIKCLLLIFTTINFNTYSQDTTFYFLNSDWKKCKKIEASYFRKKYKKNNLWMLEDYYISGQLQMTGSYKKKSLKIKEGEFIYYYENGQVSSKSYYVNDYYNGLYSSYYENGNLKYEGKYVDGFKEERWDSYYKNGNKYSEIDFKNGEYNGDCYWFFENSQMSSHENYSMNKLNSIEFWNEDGSKFDGEPEVEVQANFEGGKLELQNFMKENVVYPEKALERLIKGKVIIKFVIDTEGEISDVKVVKSVHPLLDKEALRVVKMMPNWNPGKLHNIPIKSYFSIPINFTF